MDFLNEVTLWYPLAISFTGAVAGLLQVRREILSDRLKQQLLHGDEEEVVAWKHAQGSGTRRLLPPLF
jgi:hypothetical protein